MTIKIRIFGSLTLLLIVFVMTGCSPDGGNQAVEISTNTEPAVTHGDDQADTTEHTHELAGTSWRLVKIMGMDDSLAEPRDRSLYTLEFGQDGRMTILADCNRGSGSWISGSPPQLEFGPIAATLAMCPPGSISDKYLAQFEWVRSYVMKDGHLFLATMADGSIIEFEPNGQAAD